MLILYGILFIIIENINAKREPRVTEAVPVVCSDSSSDRSLPDDGDDPRNIPVRSNDRRCFGTGVSRGVAAEFTFFLAIPVMFGASALKLFKFGLAFTPMQVFLLLLGMLVSFGVSDYCNQVPDEVYQETMISKYLDITGSYLESSYSFTLEFQHYCNT